MTLLARIHSWFRAAFRRPDLNKEISDELSVHIDLHAADLQQQGVPAGEAVRRARAELGGFDGQREAMRQALGLRWLDELRGDVGYALRALRRSPAFACTAILTIAIGIGANAAVFSIVDAALFRPLPYAHADRLVDIVQTARNPLGEHVQISASGRNIQNLRSFSAVFDGVEGYGDGLDRELPDGGQLSVGAVTPGFADLIGVRPQLGRMFNDDDVPAGDRIILSDSYWRQAFQGDRAAIGRTVALANRAYTIVGVMPPTFRFFVGPGTHAWLALPPRDVEWVVARLRPGLTLEQGQRDIDIALADPGRTWKPVRLELQRSDSHRAPVSTPRGRSTRTMLLTLLGAVGLLMTIACANVAHLLVARTQARGLEIATRRALGATRARLTRQFLIEGLVLAGLGGAAAAVVAWWGLQALPAIVPRDLADSVLGVFPPSLDTRTFGVGGAAVLLTGVACGVSSAARGWRRSGAGELGVGQRIAGISRREVRLRDGFQALQVATAIVLLSGAGLLLASFIKMVTVPVGFDPVNLAYVSVSIPQGRRVVARPAPGFVDELVAYMRTIPGVREISIGPPPTTGYAGNRIVLDNTSGASAAEIPAEMFPVSPDYFHVARIALTRGRAFTADDRAGGPRVAIVSESTARLAWPGENPLGRRFTRFRNEPPLTVVGVVHDTRTIAVARRGAQVYVPAAQDSDGGIIFRTDGELGRIPEAIRAKVQTLDPRVVSQVAPVVSVYERFDPAGPVRFYSLLLGTFAGLALITAAVGLYGLLSYSVTRRTREIGVRMALGADRSKIGMLIWLEAIRPVVVGLVIGLTVTFWVSDLLTAQLFQTTPRDPAALAAITALFLACCALAAWIPVSRAVRVDPTEAMRAE